MGGPTIDISGQGKLSVAPDASAPLLVVFGGIAVGGTVPAGAKKTSSTYASGWAPPTPSAVNPARKLWLVAGILSVVFGLNHAAACVGKIGRTPPNPLRGPVHPGPSYAEYHSLSPGIRAGSGK